MRQLLCHVFVLAAHASRRLTTGLLFIAGGFRNIAHFKDVVPHFFQDYNAASYDITDGFNRLEHDVYQQIAKPGGRVCVIGCGTGRDLLPFVAAGLEVVGVEPSPGPVARLRQRLQQEGKSAEIIQGFAEDVAYPGVFDAIIFSPHCYSYIPGSARRVQLLRSLRRHLAPDGRIAINFLRRTGHWSRIGIRIAATVAWLTRSDCPWEPHDVVDLAIIEGGTFLMFNHYFLPDEVHEEARQAGLKLIDHRLDAFLGPMSVVGPAEEPSPTG